MLQQELADSIGQLELDLRAADKDRSGLVTSSAFARILRRSGGSAEQAEALIEQFGVSGRAVVRYVDLLDSMRRLADGTMASPLARSDSSAGPRSVSPLSDENEDEAAEEVAQPQRREAWQPPLRNTVSLRRDNSASDRSCRSAAAHNRGGGGGRDTFYSTGTVLSLRQQSTVDTSQSNGASHRFALPRGGKSTVAESRQQHRAPRESGTEMRATSFVERAAERAASPVQRNSSVERMVQQAKLRAFSGSPTPDRSETLREEAILREESSKRREKEFFRLPHRQESDANSRGSRRTRGGETSIASTNTTTRVGARDHGDASFARGAYPADATLQHNTSRGSHGASSTAGISGRGELFSLREVFRVIDHDQDGIVTLREVWNAFQRRGIDVSLIEMEALADSLDLDVSDVRDPVTGGVDDSGCGTDRILGSVDFCMLVSRMRSSLIERIRRTSLWFSESASSPSPPPPPLLLVPSPVDCRLDATAVRRQHGGGNSQGAALQDPILRSPVQQQQQHQQSVAHLNVNSFSPPPSVHTSVAVSHLAELGLTETPQGRTTAGAAAAAAATVNTQFGSASTVSVSPSPEMSRPKSLHTTPTGKTLLPPPSRFGEAANGTESVSSKIAEQDVPIGFRSQSPHPYDVPTARGLQQDIELSVPPPYTSGRVNCSTMQPMSSSRMAAAIPVTESSELSSATGRASNNYDSLRREMLARQKQRVEEEEFLRRLEKEFQEKYSSLMDETSGERGERQSTFPTDVHHSNRGERSLPPPPSTMRQRAGRLQTTPHQSTSVYDHEAMTAPPSPCADAPPTGGGGGSNSSSSGGGGDAVARLLRPTASSRAHERGKKLTYHPPRRAAASPASSSTGRVSAIIRKHSPVANAETASNDSTLNRRGSIGSAGHKREVRHSSIRSLRPLSPPTHDAATLAQHYRTSNAESRTASAHLRGTEAAGPSVVRVSLVPGGAAAGGRAVCSASEEASDAAAADGVDSGLSAGASAHQQRLPPPGMPPRPPPLSSVNERRDGGSSVPTPISRQISAKLYGKCSQLLSLCSNYDRAHDGFVSPKDLGRALYAVAPDLTESEIGELVRAGLAMGDNRSCCHYVSLVGDLVVQESYVHLHEETPDDNDDNNNDVNDVYSAGNVSPESPRPTIAPVPVPMSSSRSAAVPVEQSTLEDRVRKGRLKMNRLLREELLNGCNGDYHHLRNAFFAHDDIRTGYVEERVLRECLAKLFRGAQRPIPTWVVDRCVRLCRSPFEREMIAAAAAADGGGAVAPPAESHEEEAARRRVHGIPQVLHGVLCDYRYLLEELRL
ncbi:calmodulin [Trypanosoma grayi]|uniref:calmodulin n=1 Tax=Trypanosoma grayi TaxID=71804 RepID=UPI0004F44F31|nr:calmodulin [Trypanosoma grayi]KEG13652.1 calmodulin [Trypanosoma grayi]